MVINGGVQPPMRRVLAIDPGSRSLRLLLAKSGFGRLRLLKEEHIDLQAEGLVSAEETKAYLQTILDAWGAPPLALVVPQHLSTSQVVDLPPVPETEVRKLIHDESVKLSGASESRLVYDFVRIAAPAKGRQQFWVTLCQEKEIHERLSRLGLDQEDICEVTTTANALIASFRAVRPESHRAIIVHQGAQTTSVVILLEGQGAFATSFQMGGDFFTRSLARVLNCPEEKAESLKRQTDLFKGPDACAGFIQVVEGWVAELKRQLNDWFADQPGMAEQAASFELIASGGGFRMPGFLDYLKVEAGLSLQPWPKSDTGQGNLTSGFEVAFGAVLQALGHSVQPVSLLPESYRLAWKKRLARQRVEFASVMLILLCALLLGAATWHKLRLIERKEGLLHKARAGAEAVSANEALMNELTGEYDLLRPVFAAQQNTLDTLKTFSLLQTSRTNRSFWYVLIADQQSYFSLPASGIASTNKPAKTNAPATLPERLPVASTVTNLASAKPGCIAELCVPESPETARAVLSQVVNELKQQPIFSKVDLLSDDLRRNLADPKVVLPERHFVLALDFAATDFLQPLRPKKPAVRDRLGPRRLARTPSTWPPGSETGEAWQ